MFAFYLDLERKVSQVAKQRKAFQEEGTKARNLLGGWHWAMALERDGEEAEPVERSQRWNSLVGGGPLRFPAWTTVCLSEGIHRKLGDRKISIYRDGLG